MVVVGRVLLGRLLVGVFVFSELYLGFEIVSVCLNVFLVVSADQVIIVV